MLYVHISNMLRKDDNNLKTLHILLYANAYHLNEMLISFKPFATGFRRKICEIDAPVEKLKLRGR